MSTLNVTYKSITINGSALSLSGNGRISFKAPYNNIKVVMNPNQSLSYFEVRVTPDTTNGINDYDVGVGTRPYWTANVKANADTTFNIPVSSTYFVKGPGTYRLSLYAQSALDSSWDVTYIFMVLGSSNNETQNFIASGSSGLEVQIQKDTPTN